MHTSSHRHHQPVGSNRRNGLDLGDSRRARSYRFQRGFGLVEALMLVTLISVISSFAIPKITYYKAAAKTVTQQQNAENIVSIFTAGQDGGSVQWVTTSRNACIADVVAGKAAPASSIFAGKVFRVPNIKGADLRGVYRYIGMDAKKNLFFDKNGGQCPR